MSNGLPVTTKMHPRPVWARYLRRRAQLPLDPPTDDEKHDAIQVLHLNAWNGIMSPTEIELLREAQRIMDEAYI